MKKILVLFVLISFFSCKSSLLYKKAENGDLLFVEAKKENLSGAINRATKNDSSTISYDHVALVEVKENKKYILHSSTENGSEKMNLKLFIKNKKKENRKLGLYRLKDKSCIDNAIYTANNNIGKPYNFKYLLDENSYYCSDFIERAFRKNKIFELQPMNFKNYDTGKIDSFWIEYYKKWNIDVPQNAPGTNPNTLSLSKKLNIILIEK